MTPVTAHADAPASARTMRLDALALFVLALAANGLAAHFITQPGYTDAYYYFGGARQLATGHGLSEPYLWNYLSPVRAVDPAIPLWPSHLYWMPLVSILAAPFIAIANQVAGGAASPGVLFPAAQLPFILLAACLPVLSYGVAAGLGGQRRMAWAAGLMTLFSPFYFVFWTTTDAFALFALTAAGALVLAAQAEAHPAQPLRWLFAAGLAAGLAHLSRADGLLLLACLLAWVGLRRARLGTGPGRRDELIRRLSAVAAMLGGYAIVMGPWFLRNWIVVGAPLAPGAARTVWLTNYDDIFTFTPERLSLANYLATGMGAILSGKWAALVANVQTLIAVQCAIVGFPFVLIGLWRLRANPLMRLAAFYGGALLVAMTLIFTFPGARGGYFHSGAALLPFFMPAAVVGLDTAVEAAARILRHWQPERSKPIFTGLLVGGVVVLSGVVFWQRVVGADIGHTTWSGSEKVYAEVSAWLAMHGQAGAIAAVNDPPGWNYWTEQPAIVVPNGEPATLQRAMSTFGAHWLVLDQNRPMGLSDLYAAPQDQDVFVVRAQFSDSAGKPVYLLEMEPGP